MIETVGGYTLEQNLIEKSAAELSKNDDIPYPALVIILVIFLLASLMPSRKIIKAISNFNNKN